MSNALIRLEQVGVTFAGQNVLENIALSVEPGQIVTLIGPNGAGKTTLVRAVLGLLKPHSGTVWRKPKLRVGYMPQKLMIDRTMPMTAARFLSLPTRHSAADTAAMLARVGVPEVGPRPLTGLPGGQMQPEGGAQFVRVEPRIVRAFRRGRVGARRNRLDGVRRHGHPAAQRRGDHPAGGDRPDPPRGLQGHLRHHPDQDSGGVRSDRRVLRHRNRLSPRGEENNT